MKKANPAFLNSKSNPNEVSDFPLTGRREPIEHSSTLGFFSSIRCHGGRGSHGFRCENQHTRFWNHRCVQNRHDLNPDPCAAGALRYWGFLSEEGLRHWNLLQGLSSKILENNYQHYSLILDYRIGFQVGNILALNWEMKCFLFD